MIRLQGLSLIGGALAFALTIGVVQATPLSNAAAGVQSAAGNTADSSLIPVHECNRVCERGPVEEWAALFVGIVTWQGMPPGPLQAALDYISQYR
jgi:hypothetical protein